MALQCRRDLDEHGAASICAKNETADMLHRAALLLQLHAEATTGIAARRHKLQVRVQMSFDRSWHWSTYRSDCHTVQVAAARHMYQMQVEEMLPHLLPQLLKRSHDHRQHQLSAEQALLKEHQLYNARVCLCTPA